MLAVFANEMAPFPNLDQFLNLYTSDSVSAMESGLAKDYSDVIPTSFLIDLKPFCMLATTVDPENIIPTRFLAQDGIFCILRGRIENIDALATKFGFNKDNDHITIFLEAYLLQRRINDGPETYLQKFQREYYWLSFIKAVKGMFSIVLFDDRKKTLFAATDCDAHVPLYWGIDVIGDIVLTTDSQMAKLGCHKAYGSFPKGCYLSTGDGLKNFDDQVQKINLEEALDTEGDSYIKVIMSGDSSEGSTESTARD